MLKRQIKINSKYQKLKAKTKMPKAGKSGKCRELKAKFKIPKAKFAVSKAKSEN